MTAGNYFFQVSNLGMLAYDPVPYYGVLFLFQLLYVAVSCNGYGKTFYCPACLFVLFYRGMKSCVNEKNYGCPDIIICGAVHIFALFVCPGL